MAVLKSKFSFNFISIDICRLMKNQSHKERPRRKTDSNFNFFQAAKLLMRL